MSQKVLFIKLLLVHYATQSQTEMHVNCNEDVSLKCPDAVEHMDFLSLTWYKWNNNKKQGIVRKVNTDKTPQYYNFPREAKFGEKHSLLLHRVTAEDSGSYECAINANIGGQNLYLNVNLIINVCSTEADPTEADSTEADSTEADLTTVANVLNISHSGVPCHNQVKDLPILWSVMGLVAMGLVKILLALISIGVIRAVRSRSSRRQQMTW